MRKFLDELRDTESALSRYIRKLWCDPRSGAQQPYVIQEPATPRELQVLETLGGRDLLSIYTVCNGLILCAPGQYRGLLIYAIDEIPAGNEYWKAWFDDLEEDELWDFQKHGLAFGEILESGNYLVAYGGQVYFADHEGAEMDEPWAASVNEFFDRIAHEPDEYLDRML
ncbi:MAG: hypothetical protein AAFX44_15845 [Pseudomonadota bacterium]